MNYIKKLQHDLAQARHDIRELKEYLNSSKFCQPRCLTCGSSATGTKYCSDCPDPEPLANYVNVQDILARLRDVPL